MNRPAHRSRLHWPRLAILALALAGCQAQIHESGVILNADALTRIQPGISTRTEVIERLGPPTLVNPYRPNRWLYIQDRKFKNAQRTFARVTNRVEITFDSSGVVREIHKNFDDQPWDPTTMPEANSDKGWMHWLWDRSYAKSVTELGQSNDQNASPSAANPPATRTEAATHKPWWRFWSRDEELDPNSVRTMPPEEEFDTPVPK
ncbi:MAG: outer membrane protein assembly factor BamE [Magnetococcales bacterium]|nr:outer membrane protein assembly factor BamE [Magnetococcales bacterium]NGZ07294.1 outer membrane protein assembly factor BamE [Magnetococcales bacterium]